jgi:NuA3 HAT complex component NTO1
MLTFCRLDGKGIFRQGLSSIRTKLEERFYTSISGFSAHLASVFTSEIGVKPAGDTAELQMQMGGRAPELSLEQREKRTLAKRIIKAIQPALEDGIRKESELNRKPFENELKDLDCLLEGSVQFKRSSPAPVADHSGKPQPNGTGEVGNLEVIDANAAETVETTEQPQTAPGPAVAPESAAEDQGTDAEPTVVAPPAEAEAVLNGEAKEESVTPQPPKQPPVSQNGPLTPPLSSQDDQQLPLAQGGVQWYMQPFDPVGTTIHEERWTGRDVMRGMSEELSELDEAELEDLVDAEPEQQPAMAPDEGPSEGTGDDAPVAEPPVKVHRTRRRGFK